MLFNTLLLSSDAATEGLRVIRREPRAVLTWCLLWLAWLLITAVAVASGRRVEISTHTAHWTLWQIISRFGPYAVVLIGLFFLILGMTAIATFRAVLQPHDRRFFYLRLGWDELRVTTISLMAFSLVAIFGSGPGVLLIALASPIMAAVPAAARDIADFGAFATVTLDIWLCVRLSLISVETFAEHRFHLAAYWPMTRGRFWYLFYAYVILALMLFVATTMFLPLTGMIFDFAMSHYLAGGDPLTNSGAVADGLLGRIGLFAMAGVLAVLSAAFWMFNLTLFCACQAHAYRAITTRRPWG